MFDTSIMPYDLFIFEKHDFIYENIKKQKEKKAGGWLNFFNHIADRLLDISSPVPYRLFL